MAKVNFGRIRIETITGDVQEVDFREVLGNQLYMQGKDIDECELGKRIYYAKDEDGKPIDVELSDKEVAIVKGAVSGYSYISRTAIEEAMK